MPNPLGSRNSHVVWRYRPKAVYASARRAWDELTRRHQGELNAMRLMEGHWTATIEPSGETLAVSQQELRSLR